MCGIVGLYLKDHALEPELGALLAGMLGTLCDRGPDSAGFAVYGAAAPGAIKLTIRGPRTPITPPSSAALKPARSQYPTWSAITTSS